MRRKSFSALSSLLLAALFGTLPLSGATIMLLDFDNDGPNPFGFWNILGAPNSGAANLVDSTGAVTPISVSSSGWNVGLGYQLDNWTTGDVSWVQDNAADDGWSVDDGVASITFSGLNDLFNYRVEVISTSRFNGDVADYMLEGSFASFTYTGAAGTPGDNWDAKVDGNDAGDWMIWDNVAPNASGELTLTVDGTGSFGDVSAIRLVQVPEPHSLILAGSALLFGFRRRR